MRSLGLFFFALVSAAAVASSQDTAKHVSEAPAANAVATAGAGGRSVFRDAGTAEETHLILEIPASGDAREKSVLLRHAKDKASGLTLAYKAPDLHNPKRKGKSVPLSLDVFESVMRSAISDDDLKALARTLSLSDEQKKNIQNNDRRAILSLFRLAKDGEGILLKRLWKEIEQRKLDTAGDYAAAFAALNPDSKAKSVSLEVRDEPFFGYAVAVREKGSSAPGTVTPTLAFNGAAPQRASPAAAQPTAARAAAPAAPKAPVPKVSAPAAPAHVAVVPEAYKKFNVDELQSRFDELEKRGKEAYEAGGAAMRSGNAAERNKQFQLAVKYYNELSDVKEALDGKGVGSAYEERAQQASMNAYGARKYQTIER